MKYVRTNILEPIVIPLVALALIAFGALNLSRLFLASASAGRAVVVATVISAVILGGAMWATARERIERGVLLGGAALAGLLLSGAGLLADEVDRNNHGAHEETEVASTITFAASNFVFDPADLTTAGPLIGVTLSSTEGSHSWVVEGHESDLRLEASTGGSDAGEITLEPSGYVFYCDIPGHRDAGMEGTLTVTEGGGDGHGEEGSEAGEGAGDGAVEHGEEGAGAGAGGEPEGAEAPAGPSPIEVIAANVKFPSDAYDAKAGKITFEYVNEDALPHTLVVEGHEDDMKIEVGSRETKRGSITLDAGTYVLYCDIAGHRQAGMVADLTVT